MLYEAKILRLLQGEEGTPVLYWAGQEGEYNIMVMELLGPSLEDLFHFCGTKLTLKTCLIIAKQMVTCFIEECIVEKTGVFPWEAVHTQGH